LKILANCICCAAIVAVGDATHTQKSQLKRLQAGPRKLEGGAAFSPSLSSPVERDVGCKKTMLSALCAIGYFTTPCLPYFLSFMGSHSQKQTCARGQWQPKCISIIIGLLEDAGVDILSSLDCSFASNIQKSSHVRNKHSKNSSKTH